MKKFNYFVLSFVAVLMATAVTAQTTVLGYFPSYRATSVVRYDKFTDIVFAFINPNTDGTLNQANTGGANWAFDYNKFVTIKSGCQTNGVNLWIALGGADSQEQRAARLSSVSNNSTYRANLVSDLVSFAITHGCIGIDVDWEFPKDATARNGHKLLIQDLRAAINSSSNPNLKISIAVGGEYKNSVNHLQYIDKSVITDASLIDKVNIMAYDFPTTYNVNHSSYTDAEQSMTQWNQVNGVPYDKMLLGIPFYARNSWGEKMYSELTGTASVNYTSDEAGGYYYNGKTTIEAKMDLVSTKGAKGILIWDIGQDRPAGDYSLLDAIDAKAATLCPVPKPNLGADRGVCSGQSTTLDPGVSSSSGRTFAWTKDGASTGGNTTTLTVSEAGTYKVVITEGSCTREDEVVIVTGSSVTTTGAAGCNNEQLTVSVNNPDGTKTYKWYDAATSGTLLHTGTSYSATFPTSTTVYVEEAAAGVNTYTTSPQTIPDGKFHAWAGTQFTMRCAQMLVVETDLTVKSLRSMVSAKNGCTYSVKVIQSNNGVAVTEAGPFTYTGDASAADWAAAYHDIDVDLALSPGSYFIWLEPTSGNEGNYGIVNSHTEEHAESGVFTLKGSTFQSGSDETGFNPSDEGQSWWAAYGPFLNWTIETGANASCGRSSADVTVQQCGPPVVSISSPTANQAFTYSDPATDVAVSLAADVSDEGTLTSVVFEIYKGGALVETVTTSVTGSTYSGTFTSGVTGSDYQLKITATDNDNNTTTETVDFSIDKTVGVATLSAADVQLFPNPSSDEFNITVGDASSFTLSVYTVSGQLVETANVSGNSATFGGELAAGTYVVRAVSAAGSFQTQVVKK